MITVSRTVHTATPLDKCWGYLSEFANTEIWDPGTVSCKRLDVGPVDVGARYENVSKFRDRETTLQYQVVTFEPARHITLDGTNKTVESVDDMQFTGSDTGTEVVYTARFTFKGAVRLAEPFLHKAMEKLADEAQAGIQKALDGL
jgi:carbon monoxide dehydrogenase subunit G